MALPLSGFPEDVELAKIEHPDFSLIIKGKPFHQRYEGLKQYRKMGTVDVMQFSVKGTDDYQVFDVETMTLSCSTDLRPIFFENGVYQIVVLPKGNKKLSFYHEHPLLRNAISAVNLNNLHFLMGSLQFQNEVGLSTFEIRSGKETLLEVTLEVFPTKLDYKRDYQKLLEEVNEEIYNLAFHFIKKTYLGARINLDGNPTKSEFYRLITRHFNQFIRAVSQIEKQPHHQLNTVYSKVRGDQLGKMDAVTRKFFQHRSHLFVEVNNGIDLAGRSVMPREGLKAKKELTYDTFENRYVKWMILRLVDKLDDLLTSVCNRNFRAETVPDEALIQLLNDMKKTLESRSRNLFWRRVGRLDRSAMSLVLQMAPGYREAYQTFLTVSKGLMLQGQMYRMSVKDVATLYEYWTFLKLGQILASKYEQVDQDIVKVNRNGLFVNLEPNKMSRRIFRHPVTKERIELVYQKHEGGLPTLTQKPDTMLSIQKKGKNHPYNYVFDAKYRIDYAQDGSYYGNKYKTTGPMEDDINTMHRYRDAIVTMSEGPYERTAFGAYVLFPWNDEEIYKEHHFYQSIDKVNIGGFPFLPNTTELVEQFVERLIDKSPEELQQEGILPRGTQEDWRSSLIEKVLVGLVASKESYVSSLQTRTYRIPAAHLRRDWQEAKYVALYVKAGIESWKGIREYGKITSVEIEGDSVILKVDVWKTLKQVISPVHYGISTYMMTSLTQLKEAKELPELYLKSRDEMVLWRILRRISDQVQIKLNAEEIDNATCIEEFTFGNEIQLLVEDEQVLVYRYKEKIDIIDLALLMKRPSAVFRKLVEYM